MKQLSMHAQCGPPSVYTGYLLYQNKKYEYNFNSIKYLKKIKVHKISWRQILIFIKSFHLDSKESE